MPVIQFITSGGMAAIGGDLPDAEQKKIREIVKLFGNEVREFGKKYQIPALQLRVMQATYMFAAKDAQNYHVCFVESATGDTLIYKNLVQYGNIPLPSILHQLKLEVGEPIWAVSVPIHLDSEGVKNLLKDTGKQYVEAIMQAQQSATKPPSGQSLAVPEIAAGMERFRKDYPVGQRTAFIVMSFQKTELHDLIVSTIKTTLKKHGIIGVRADDKEYMDDLFPNVRVYMHGCDFGIGVFERIIQDEFNPNVSLEVGYMSGLGKNVLLLKDQNLKTLPTDLVGKLYKPFDPLKIASTMPDHIEKWLRDKGVV